MSFFEDFTRYSFTQGNSLAQETLSVGWLAFGHAFSTESPSDALLDTVWEFCRVCVVPTRGIHACDLCDDEDAEIAERRGQRLLLGTGEIRAISPDGAAFAAPTLIYHYILVHHYKPPSEFVAALNFGPRPPSESYFDWLTCAGLDWAVTPTPVPGSKRMRIVPPRM